MKSTGRHIKTRPVGRWRFLLELPADGQNIPLFLRIARGIAAETRRGRLTPGSRLPGSRELAESLGVHRNTVLAAYRELTAEGFLDTTMGKGTYITETLPEVKPRRWNVRGRPHESSRRMTGFVVPASGPPRPVDLAPPGALMLHGGVPDTSLVPRVALARAYRRALRSRRDLLDYGDPRGELRLRAALAAMLRARRGLSIEADDVFVTRGSQMALSLIGRTLLRPGDAVAVEALGYRPAWRALSEGGARLVPVPIDAEGLKVSALADLVERHPIRMVYVTPHHQYPTTVTLSASRRMELLDLARVRRFAIVEDDYDHEFHYDGRPVLPLASADDAGVVVYIGTLSKVLAPGLRLGYFVAPRPVCDGAVGFRLDLDRQGDRLTEQAVAELMEEGEVQRHVWRARRVYLARREHAIEALGALSRWVALSVPPGGLAVWATIREARLSARAWHRAAVERGVHFQPGHSFTADESDLPAVRIGFAAVTERDFARAVARLRDAAHAVMGTNGDQSSVTMARPVGRRSRRGR